MAGEALTYSLNRVAGSLGNPLSAQGAANVWASSTGLSLVGALNTRAGNARADWKPLQGVLQQMSGTTLAVDGAARALV